MKTKNKTRILTIIVIIAVAGILFSQLKWLSMAYELSREHEQHRISLALQKTADQLITYQNAEIPDTASKGHERQSLKKILTQSFIDSLIRANLKAFNIYEPFDFAVINKKTGEVAISNTKNLERLTTTSFKASIACIKNPHPYSLALTIDIEPGLVLRKIRIWLLISIILIAIIFTSFIRTIMHLKTEHRITREKMDFVNNMIHEYKTPLATINMSTDVLLHEYKNRNERKLLRYLKIIKDENNRLRQLVERIMGMTVIDRDEISLSKENIDIHHLLRRAVENLHLQFEQAGAETNMSLQAQESMVYADPVHTINLFINILDNAIKYSDKDPRISIETQNVNKDRIMIRICDNGPGIPHDQQKMVFMQFYRGKEEQNSGKSGFGLGLFYVKKIVNQHNGEVTIQSTPEQGTCFSVYLATIDKEL